MILTRIIITDIGTKSSVAMSVIIIIILFRFLGFLPSFLLALRLLRQKCPLCFLPPQLREFGFHLDDQHLEFLLTLFSGVSIDIAGVLFAVGPFGRIAAFKEMVVDLGDAAGTGSALAAHIGLEIGHTRLFRLGRGSFLPRL